MGSSRRVKALSKNKKGINPNHRSHRSKKNRKSVEFRDGSMAFKRKKEKLKEEELDEHSKLFKNLHGEADKWY